MTGRSGAAAGAPQSADVATPTVSLVTVAYNAAQTIEDTLRSVAAQTYRSLEHIVVDGGSSDATTRIAGCYAKRIAVLISEPDEGIYHAMNKGLRHCSGDVVGFLNADDLFVHEDVVRRIAGVFADSAVEACYADLVYVDRRNPAKVIRYWKSTPYREGLFKKGWVPPHPTFFVRRSVYERLGGYDTSYRLAADYELITRFMYRHHIVTAYIPEVLVKMRMGGATNRSIGNIVKQNAEIWRAARGNGIGLSAFTFVLSKLKARAGQYVASPGDV